MGTLTAPPYRSRSRPDEAGPGARRRRLLSRSMPLWLILPALVVLTAVYGYPAVRLVWLSLHEYALAQLIGTRPARFVGIAHYAELFGDPFFWTVVVRTVAFTAACVGFTIGFGMAFALLMRRASRPVRLALTATMILAWAAPWLVVAAVFEWLVDYEFGVFNYALSLLPFVDMIHHNWFVQPWQGFSVIIAVVVWQAVPFPALALYAGLMQVPHELEEAARVDGAGAWAGFWRVTFPVLRPIVLILTIYSIIWDFQVFNQAYVMLNGRPAPEYYLFSIYSFVEAFGASQYGMGGAIAVVMVVMLLFLTVFYVRRMVRIGEAS